MKKIIFLFLLAGFVQAQNTNLRQKHFLLDKGIALSGYDAVSYFSGKPVKGKTAFTYAYEGINYRFMNMANLETFKKNPAAYEPQYGGWCAYAMGKNGEKVEVDPETFKILNGKLYLFYNKFFNNTLPDWSKDETTLKKKANINWTKIYQ